MTIADVFSEFDVLDKKGFEAHDIIGALSAVEEKEKNEPEYGYEYLAFYLVPNSENNSNWGTFYGPHSIFTDADNNIIESPALSDITIDAVLYWEQRYITTKNPLLTMRYCSLVWDFKSRLFHQKNESDLYRTYVDSMLKVCNEDYARHPVLTVGILERVFSIAKNNQQDLSLVKAAYINFEKRHVNDNSARGYSSRFSLMMENRDYFSEEEIANLVNEHEQRLSRMCNPVDEKVNPWNIEKQATLLAEYYKSIKRQEDIKRVLNCIEKAFFQVSSDLSKIQLLGNLENLYKRYRDYKLEEEAKKLLVKIQQLGPEVKQELKPVQFKISLPTELLDKIKKMFDETVESDTDRWNSFVVAFIPNIQDIQQDLIFQRSTHKLSFLIPRKILDYKGRPMSIIGSCQDDEEGQIVQYMSTFLHKSDPFLNLAIETMIEVGALSTEKIIEKVIADCPIFEKERYDIIREAIELYFEGRYVLSCHLLVPQIECAIRNLVEMCGIPILQSPKNNQEYQLKTLGTLLRENVIKTIFNEDVVLYLKCVLTDQRALNIRNEICHGIIPPRYLVKSIANRLLHVLFILSMIRIQNDN